jgi:hypothetical protein
MSSFEQPTNFTSRGKEKKSSLGASPFRLAKSPLHRKIQIFLQKSYGGDDLYLEKKFPSLRRTADIVLMGQKKIIEVQTSLIGIKEMMERERDYRSLGFEVIWLLYDKVFFCDPLPLITRFFFAKTILSKNLPVFKKFIFPKLGFMGDMKLMRVSIEPNKVNTHR